MQGSNGVRAGAGFAVSVINYGTIISETDPVLIYGGGSVTNGSNTNTNALMQGDYRVRIDGAPGTVTNFGTIAAGVYLSKGGVVTNGSPADALAVMGGHLGVSMNAAGTVHNYGSITATSHSGVALDGGLVTNGTRSNHRATIFGSDGVSLSAAGTVRNFGTLEGLGATTASGGVVLAAGGSVINEIGGRIDGNDGVYAAVGPATILNNGTISGYQYLSGLGIDLRNGGLITNGGENPLALIYRISSIGGTIFNLGTIEGPANTYDAVYISGAPLTNRLYGLIRGASGVDANNGVVTNQGVIRGVAPGLGAGVFLRGSASLNNTGTVSGNIGVDAFSGGGAKVTNFGRISGRSGIAVMLQDASDVLQVGAGASFDGAVVGAASALELSGLTGTISGLFVGGFVTVTASGLAATTTFQNFGAVTLDAASAFTLAGSATVAVGEVLTVASTAALGVAGTLTVVGALDVGGTLSGAGALALSGGGTATFESGAQLTIAHLTEAGGTTTATAEGALTYAGMVTQASGSLLAVGGANLTFTGTANSFAGTLGGAGTITFLGGADMLNAAHLSAVATVISNAKVTLTGSVFNSSVVTVTSPSVVIAAAGATLSGAGMLSLSNLSTNKIAGASAAATLTNVNNKIAGAGQLGGGSMVLINESAGVVNANRPTALIVDTGASTIVNGGLLESSSTGGLTVNSAVNNTGTLLAAAGTVLVKGAVTGAGQVRILAGTADFMAGFGENVIFLGGSTGVLELSKSTAYAGTVSGFSTTGKTFLDLVDVVFSGSTKATFSGTTASGTLTVTDGAHTAKIKLAGDYTKSSFILATDGHGGTLVHDPAKAAPPPVSTPHAFAAAIAAHHPAPFAPRPSYGLHAQPAINGLSRPRTAIE